MHKVSCGDFMTIKEKRAWGVIKYFLKFHSVQHSQKFFFENNLELFDIPVFVRRR